jgi:Leucine-rich repeat (LRR) protein
MKVKKMASYKNRIISTFALLSSLNLSYGDTTNPSHQDSTSDEISVDLDSIFVELGALISSYLPLESWCQFRSASRNTYVFSSLCKKNFELDLSGRIFEEHQWNRLFNPQSSFYNIKRLSLAGSNFQHEWLRDLPEGLESLDLSSCGLAEEEFLRIRHLKKLKHLNLDYNLVSSTALSMIVAQFPSLESLSVRRFYPSQSPFIMEEGLAELIKLKNLVRLDLSGHPLFDSEAPEAHFPKLPPLLRSLKLSKTNVTYAALKEGASHLKFLEELDFSHNGFDHSRIDEKTLAEWIAENFPSITHLNLNDPGTSGVHQTSESIRTFLSLVRLQTLGLGGLGNPVTRDELPLIVNLKKLKSLDLHGADFNFEDFKSIGENLPDLLNFSFRGTQLTFDELKSVLSYYPHLKKVSFGLNHQDGEKIADLLNQYPQLEQVNLFHTVPLEVRENLSAQFPQVRFRYFEHFEN